MRERTCNECNCELETFEFVDDYTAGGEHMQELIQTLGCPQCEVVYTVEMEVEYYAE